MIAKKFKVKKTNLKMQTTEQYIFDIPFEQVELITKLMDELNVKFKKIEPSIDEELTPEQYSHIMEGIKQADAGDVITLEEFKKESEQWFIK